MKKTTCIFLVLMMVGIFGCKRDSDVLATYKGGNITRGEFYTWLDARRFSRETLLKNKARQKDKIESLAIEKITVEKAKSEGFDKDEEFRFFNEVATENVLIKRLYDREIKEKAHFKEPAVKIRQIMLRVKDFDIDSKKRNKRLTLSKNELDKRTNETIARAKEIIEKLDKGAKFEELAKQYSEDFSKQKGGDMGYVVRGMMPQEFFDAAFALKKGDYTKEPVVVKGRGVYIIKAEETEELTEKNIEKIIENKSQAMNIKNSLLRNYSKDYMDKLMNAPDVKFFDNKAVSKNNADILFKIGEKNYIVGDMMKRIELRSRGANASGRSEVKINDDQRKNMARSFFQYEILKREAFNKGIDKDPEFLKESQARTDSLIAREYTNKLLSTDVKVTYNEIKEEYNKNKESRYYKMVNVGNKRVKKPEPFNAVKDRIERNLLSMKKSEKRKSWVTQILQEYNYKLNESELEGKK